jgi:hypothetical protein
MTSTTTSRITRSLLVAALLAGSAGASATMVGVPGEAQLVPLAVFAEDSGAFADFNTYVIVTAPASFQRDTIFTDFTAINVAPDTGGYAFPGTTQTVFWYFYDKDGVFVSGASGSFALGPDGSYLFDWRREAIAKGLEMSLENQPGALVFATQAARGGAVANFAIEAKAFLTTDHTDTVFNPLDIFRARGNAEIPVLAMSDGADSAGVGPRIGNEVVYTGNVPSAFAPLITGLRLSNGDGDQNDTVNFGMPLLVGSNTYGTSSRQASSLLVIWLDAAGPASRIVSVVDSVGNTCDATVDLSDHLNTLYAFESSGGVKINREPFNRLTPAQIAALPNLCYPTNSSVDLDGDTVTEPFENSPGFVRITLPEGVDSGPGTGATSAGAAFSILFPDEDDEEGGLPSDADGPFTWVAMDRGK